VDYLTGIRVNSRPHFPWKQLNKCISFKVYFPWTLAIYETAIYIRLSYYVNGIAPWNFDRFGFRAVTASASLKSQQSNIK